MLNINARLAIKMRIQHKIIETNENGATEQAFSYKE
jgi:hypothetical protein